jgi:RimJ/RimL family protein N-acetyltransferase
MYLTSHETERLHIRPLKFDDIPIWKTFFEDNPKLSFLPLDSQKNSQEHAEEWLMYQYKRYEENRYGHLALICKDTCEFVGQCGLLTQEVDGEEVLEIGYHILPAYWGNGYAPEAAQFMRDFAFTNKLTDKLVSIIDIRNTASQRVAEKNGMKKGKQTKYWGLDVNVYEITKEEWLMLMNRN